MTSALKPAPGKLIVLEGLDGVGKTTQVRLLAQYLSGQGLPVVLTREPTDGAWGRQLRRIIRQGRQGLPPEAELELFVADRREHVREIIGPALASGKIVITDRYYYSSMAYQGALGLAPREIEERHADFAPPPDLVIILELPLPEVQRRLKQRGGPLSPSFERLDYLGRVAAIFQSIQGEDIVRVDGRGSPGQVHARIVALVQGLLLPTDHPAARPEEGEPEHD